MNNAFTLTEMLIAIFVIALLSAFAIPKVITSSNITTSKASFRIAASNLQTALRKGALTGEAFDQKTYDYLESRIDYQKACPTHCYNEGCSHQNDFRADEPGLYYVMACRYVVLTPGFVHRAFLVS